MSAAARIFEGPAYRRGQNLDEEGLFELVTDEVFRDGEAGPEERRLLFVLAAALRLDETRARGIAHRSHERFLSGGLGVARPFDTHQLYARVLRYCLADGGIDLREKKMIEGIYRLFDLTPDDHQRIVFAVRQDPSSTQNAMPVRSRPSRPQPRPQPLPVAPPARVRAEKPVATLEERPSTPAPERRITGHTPGATVVSALFILGGLVAAVGFELWPALLLTLAGAAGIARERRSFVALDARGLTIQNLFTQRTIAWEDMRALSRGVVLHHTGGFFTGAAVKIAVWTRQGEEVRFTRAELTKARGPYRELYEAMFAHIGSHLLLEDLAQYRNQGAVTFGTLSASEEGLRIPGEGKLLEWSRLCRVWVEGGRLFLMEFGSTAEDFSAPVEALPNSFSLLEILRQHGHTVAC